MCTRPDRRSVPTTLVAAKDAVLAALLATGVLLVAVATAPGRWLVRRQTARVKPSSVAQVDVQIHLEDARCVAELRRVIRQTLRRTARTWAPLPIPIDRVVVGVGFPRGGKVDLYAQFPDGAHHRNGTSRPLVVISLGLREGDRELEPAEVAGALAALVQAVIDDRYREAKTVPRGAVATSPSTGSPASSSTGVSGRSEQTVVRPVRAATHENIAMGVVDQRMNDGQLPDPEPPRLQEFLARQQQDQPLVAAGPTSNGTHP